MNDSWGGAFYDLSERVEKESERKSDSQGLLEWTCHVSSHSRGRRPKASPLPWQEAGRVWKNNSEGSLPYENENTMCFCFSPFLGPGSSFSNPFPKALHQQRLSCQKGKKAIHPEGKTTPDIPEDKRLPRKQWWSLLLKLINFPQRSIWKGLWALEEAENGTS